MTEIFAAEWLARREPFDSAARSRTLAFALAGLLSKRPRVLDLGAGTGGMFRFLAPIIGRPQVWTFAEADKSLLGEGFGVTAEWAVAQGWTVTWPNRALVLHAPSGAWRIEGLVTDFGTAPPTRAMADADAVVCSALLDLVSAAWLERLAATLRAPFLACLTVDGRTRWMPRNPADTFVAAGFRRDQAREKGFGRALGPRAGSAARAILARHGFAVRTAPSDWYIPRDATAMLTALLETTAAAAMAATPAHRSVIAAWRSRRLEQIALSRASVRLGHRDLLAIPPLEKSRPVARGTA